MGFSAVVLEFFLVGLIWVFDSFFSAMVRETILIKCWKEDDRRQNLGLLAVELSFVQKDYENITTLWDEENNVLNLGA